MASGFLMLLDDIAALADDVATMSKMAFKKTAGVLGDDLALNAQQVSGVQTNRELPVVYGVFKGSLINKLILVPLALLISYFIPQLLTPLLMIGGAFLCYEGFESIYERFFHKEEITKQQHDRLENVKQMTAEEILQFEKTKIKGAIRTDFILSAEIIVISLSAMEKYSMIGKIISLSFLAIGFTFLVYGLVALIVRLDDIGIWFKQKQSSFYQSLGQAFILVVPYLMRILSEIGLLAMLLVGGGIIVHGIHPISAFIQSLAPTGILNTIIPIVANMLVALIVGFFIFLGHLSYLKIRNKKH